MVSLKLTIGSEVLTSTSVISSRSVIHLSKCTYPHVAKITSPLANIDTSTDGSNLFNFLSPCKSYAYSLKSFAVKATFKILLAPKCIGSNEGHAFSDDTVADLKTV